MRSKNLSLSPIQPAHAYTQSDVPWIITVSESAYGKMVNYLSGGGMRTFGRTVRQEELYRRHRRFLIGVASLGALWLVFLFL